MWGITNAKEAYYAEQSQKLDRAVSGLSSIPQQLVAQFLTGPMTGEAIHAAGIAFKQALIEASLNAELTHHLGYAPGADRPASTANQRNDAPPRRR